MGGIAALAKSAGHRVTGCDANVYPPMSTQLADLGIDVVEGFDANQRKLAPDLWVIGNVVTRGNPLMEAILDAGDRYVSGPEWLAANVLQGRRTIAVAGTHGKTTTSSMVAWLLEDAGMAPSFLIGGVPENFGVSARLSAASDLFVIEADEYDTAFFDKRSKFVHYRPRIAILNNLEFDHADIFPDLGAIETQFHHLVRTIPRGGRIVANGREAAMDRVLARGCWTPVERFGTDDGWHVGRIDGDAFEVCEGATVHGEARWSLLGDHNRQNALAAVAAVRHAGVEPARAVASLGGFRNVKRRMETRGTVRGITVYDDFAHHPTAIETTTAGLRAKVGRARILAVLEPRSNTMKLGIMKDALAGSLRDADLVFCYGANLGWDATDALASLGERAVVHADFDALVAAVAQAALPGDHVLVMSNGGFNGIHAKLLERLGDA